MLPSAPPLPPAWRRALWALLALGLITRIVIAFATYGLPYDMDSLRIVGGLLASHPLHVYGAGRWPYPPGFFPLALGAHELARVTGVAFHGLVQLPAILADAGLAWTVQRGLGSVGRGVRARVGAAALVALGPSFVVISGYHGQIDSVAVLPALLALLVWRGGGERRAPVAGLLVGLGAAVKTVPLFMVLALLPTARSRRERAILVGVAVALPALLLVPFLAADGHSTWGALRANHGIPGLGGPTLLVQPALADAWLNQVPVGLHHLTASLLAHQNLLVALGAAAAGALAWARRMEPVEAAVIVWLAIMVANVAPAFQYYVWLLPVLLLAGRWRVALALQAVLAVPTAQIYLGWGRSASGLYVAMTGAVWVALVLLLAREAWRALGHPTLHRTLVTGRA